MIPSFRFAEVAEGLLSLMLALEIVDPKLNREGGFLVVTLMHKKTSDTPLLVAKIGTLPHDKIDLTRSVALEKVERLKLLRSENNGHLSSWQSRDPEKSKWGGAIVAHLNILSFSGLPELADEALMLGVAVKLGFIKIGRAHQIADLSDNNIFRELVRLMPLTGENLDAY